MLDRRQGLATSQPPMISDVLINARGMKQQVAKSSTTVGWLVNDLLLLVDFNYAFCVPYCYRGPYVVGNHGIMVSFKCKDIKFGSQSEKAFIRHSQALENSGLTMSTRN